MRMAVEIAATEAGGRGVGRGSRRRFLRRVFDFGAEAALAAARGCRSLAVLLIASGDWCGSDFGCRAASEMDCMVVAGVVAIAAGRVLLHGSIYITELPGAPRKWSVGETWLYLGGMAAAVAAVWAAMLCLVKRAPSRIVPLSVALACGAAAVTIMMSGYATGGQAGLPLSAALVAVTMASIALPKSTRLDGALGVGIVGLFTLLVVGRFFGELTTAHAALLFLAPLSCWVTEGPYLRTLKSWQRSLLQLFFVSLPLIFVVVEAQRQFAADSEQNKGAGSASADEYQNYGR